MMKQNQTKDAIILIHGMGAQKPRNTLDSFLSGSNKKKAARITYQQNVIPPQPIQDEGKPTDQNLSYYSTIVEHENKQTFIAEMYWNDLSQLTSGFMANLLNFFNLVKNAPDIIYAAFAPDEEDNVLIKTILKIFTSLTALAFWIIYYPITMLNLAFYWHSLNLVIAPEINNQFSALVDRISNGAQKIPLLQVTNVKEEISLHFYIVSAIFSVLLLGLAVYLRQRSKPKTEQHQASQRDHDYPYYSQILLGTALIILIVIFAFWINAYLLEKPMHFDQIAKTMTVLLSTSWLSVLLIHGLIFIVLLFMLITFSSRRRKGILLGLATFHLSIRFWLVLFTSLALALVYSFYSKVLFNTIEETLIASMAFLVIFWADIILLAAIALFATFRHGRLSKRNLVNQDLTEDYPRLVISDSIKYATIFMACFFATTLVICPCILHQVSQKCLTGHCDIIKKLTAYIIYAAPIFLLIGPFFIQLARIGFEVAGDVVNTFKSQGLHREIHPWRAIKSAYTYDADKNRILPQQLRTRFEAICHDIQNNYGPLDQLTLVTHSLGTMIAFDAIKHGILSQLNIKTIKIVTMGSPMSNIFETYFPSIYGQDKGWAIPEGIATINLYRTNDYVGGNLKEHLNINQQTAYLPEGHFGYFSDEEIVKTIWTFHNE